MLEHAVPGMRWLYAPRTTGNSFWITQGHINWSVISLRQNYVAVVVSYTATYYTGMSAVLATAHCMLLETAFGFMMEQVCCLVDFWYSNVVPKLIVLVLLLASGCIIIHCWMIVAWSGGCVTKYDWWSLFGYHPASMLKDTIHQPRFVQTSCIILGASTIVHTCRQYSASK